MIAPAEAKQIVAAALARGLIAPPPKFMPSVSTLMRRKSYDAAQAKRRKER